MLPEVIQVIPTDDYKVYVYMDDNTVRLYDAAPLIAKGGIFSRIQDTQVVDNLFTISTPGMWAGFRGCLFFVDFLRILF